MLNYFYCSLTQFSLHSPSISNRDSLFLLLVLVQLIAHTILNVVVDDEVELFFSKAVMLRQKQGLYDINCALLSAMKSKYNLNEIRMRSKHGVKLGKFGSSESRVFSLSNQTPWQAQFCRAITFAKLQHFSPYCKCLFPFMVT